MQVEVADIGAKTPRLADTHLGIEVGAIEIDLTAVAMDQRANVADALLKHPMGGGVGDHQGGQLIGVLLGLGRQIGLIDVAGLIALHRHHLHARHHGAGGVGAVGTGGNQADVAVAFTALAMPSANHQQAGVLALRAGIGLQRHRRKPGDRGQPRFQLIDQLVVTLALRRRNKRMQAVESSPAHRLQLSSGIELHGAAAQRDHPVHQRKVLGDQPLDVAQQLGF